MALTNPYGALSQMYDQQQNYAKEMERRHYEAERAGQMAEYANGTNLPPWRPKKEEQNDELLLLTTENEDGIEAL